MTTNVDPDKTSESAPIEIHLSAGAAAEAAPSAGAAATAAPDQPDLGPAVFQIRDMGVWYGNHEAVRGVSMDIPQNAITAIIGPSGCGKSTALRCLNRMNDLVPGARVTGQVLFGDDDLLSADVDPVDLRGRIGMVFQKPNPFPKSIKDNLEFGMKVNGIKATAERVEQALRDAALWDEVKDRLKAPAAGISGGQQQRLSIARALAVEAEVLLMDEPTSSLDPQSTLRIEELIHELKQYVTIIIVTHNMQQAARVSDYTAFFYEGDVVETADTDTMFTNPKERRTNEYITGRFG